MGPGEVKLADACLPGPCPFASSQHREALRAQRGLHESPTLHPGQPVPLLVKIVATHPVRVPFVLPASHSQRPYWAHPAGRCPGWSWSACCVAPGEPRRGTTPVKVAGPPTSLPAFCFLSAPRALLARLRKISHQILSYPEISHHGEEEIEEDVALPCALEAGGPCVISPRRALMSPAGPAGRFGLQLLTRSGTTSPRRSSTPPW